MTTEKAIEFGKIFLKSIESEKGSATYEFVETAVKMMEQEPKSGHWIRCDVLQEFKCSECRVCFRNKSNYCPNCGCRIKGSE